MELSGETFGGRNCVVGSILDKTTKKYNIPSDQKIELQQQKDQLLKKQIDLINEQKEIIIQQNKLINLISWIA